MRPLGQTVREDAIFRPEDLDDLDEVIYEAKEDELVARQLVELKQDIDEGAETFSYDRLTRLGSAKIYSYGGADDIPLVDFDMERVTQRIYGIVVGFTTNVQELRAAQRAGRPIDTTRAAVARKAIAEKENDFFFNGDADYNAEGLLNATGIQVYSVPAGDAGGTTWATKTGLEILADIRNARALVAAQPGHEADTLVLPPNQYELLQQPVSATDTRILLAYIESVNWFRRVVKAAELVGAGVGSADSGLVFDSSPEVVALALPMDITRHPSVDMGNLTWKTPLEERCGGAIVRYPLGICRFDGI